MAGLSPRATPQLKNCVLDRGKKDSFYASMIYTDVDFFLQNLSFYKIKTVIGTVFDW